MQTPPRFDHLASRPRAYPPEPVAAENPFPAVGASCALFDAQTVSGDGEFERKREAGYLSDAALP